MGCVVELEGAVVIVTGSSSGVGAACARQLAERGANVVVNYSGNREGAEATKEAVEATGAEAIVVQANVADDGDCRKLAAAADERWGRIDGLVNNAGTTRFNAHENLEGLSAQDFHDIYAVNTIGAYQMVRAVQPAMVRGGAGSVVNVASIAAVTGVGSSVAYAASKGALVTMTLSLARALGPQLRVNAVCPGFIQGDWLREGMGEERYNAVKSSLERNSPLGMTTTADTVSEAILLLLAGGDLITGETLIVDGGHHLMTAPLGRR